MVTDAAAYWVFHGTDYLYGLTYNDGAAGLTRSYVMADDYTIMERSKEYAINRFTTYGIYKDNIITTSTGNAPAEWADANGVLIGVLGKAKTDLVRRTFEANGIRYNAIEYASNASRQHGYDIIDGLKVRPEQVLCYISGSKQGIKQAKESGFRFIGATWDAKDIDALANETPFSYSNNAIPKSSLSESRPLHLLSGIILFGFP